MKKAILLLLINSIVTVSFGQTIRYEVSFPNAIHHEAEISLIVSDLPNQATTFRMSRSSPGRYATHEFGKNVYNVKAYDRQNKPLSLTRTEGDVYVVPQHAGYVKLSYTIYGNYPDGTYMGIVPESIHLNMPATFMWVKGFDVRPIEVKFILPAGNAGKVATQLKPTADPYTFTAPGLQYFMDSPTKIGDLKIREWKAKNTDGKEITFRLALEADAADSVVSAYARKVEKVVEQARAVYGEFPTYDYGSYTFIASLNPYVKGDGMEHRNSTMIAVPAQFNGEDWTLSVFSHEFFHCWNVERIRPKTLEPFNFEKANMSNELWFAEGFTQYYGDLLLARAGFIPLEQYATIIANALYTKLTPGATQYSPIDASRHAVFVDAGVSIDKTNYPNMFTSYYPYGAAIAMALDLELRETFNKSLDDYMQAVWKRFGKSETPYTVEGLQDELARVTSKDFAASFFRKYIYGHEPIDYQTLLTKAGFVVKKAAEGKAWMGAVRYNKTDKGMALASNTVKGTPLYKAGLDIDDVITNLDGTSVANEEAITGILNRHKPGDVIQLNYIHLGKAKSAAFSLEENPNYTVIPAESAGLSLPANVQQFRKSWLGAK